jgi:hypothetical protein
LKQEDRVLKYGKEGKEETYLALDGFDSKLRD